MKKRLEYPVFVLSKGRADKKEATTIELLEQANLDHILVVEPQDVEAYKRVFPESKVVVLPHNDKGHVYVRQKVLDTARTLKLKRYWQLDDSLVGFFDRTSGSSQKTTADVVLSNIEKLADHYEKIALAAPNHEVIAFRAQTSFEFNRGAWNCILTNAETGIDYDPDVFIEDLNFTLKHLIAGWNTISHNQYCMAKRQSKGGRKGGLNDAPEYNDGQAWVAAVYEILDRYPEYTSLNRHAKSGVNIRTAWRKFRRVIKEVE